MSDAPEQLEAAIAAAIARGPMTPAELQDQRISFVFGQIACDKDMTAEAANELRERIEQADHAKYGNLRLFEADLAAAIARAERAEAALAVALEALRPFAKRRKA